LLLVSGIFIRMLCTIFPGVIFNTQPMRRA